MKILDITPPPTDEEAMAIAAALRQLTRESGSSRWPRSNKFDRSIRRVFDGSDERRAGWREAGRREAIDAGV